MTDAPVPQAVATPLTRAAIFLVLTVKADAASAAVVREFLPDLSGFVRSVCFRDPERSLTCVLGIGADAWDRLVALPRPPGLHPFVELQAGTRHAAATPGDRVTRIPIRGVRKHTAAAMVRSAFTAPHVTTFLTVDVTPTMELLASLKADRALSDHRIGVLAVAAKAVCLALGRHPELNSRWDEEAGEIVQHHYVNLGIAAATERGLVVPNIKEAQESTLVELADAIRGLAETARAGRTAPADMMGGTFSITNVGVFGVDAGTPILNPGEAGILALGAVRRDVVEEVLRVEPLALQASLHIGESGDDGVDLTRLDEFAQLLLRQVAFVA